MRIALAQMKMFNSIEENLNTALLDMEHAADNFADLILFPELQFSTFFPQYQGMNFQHLSFELNHSYIQKICNKSKELSISVSPNFYLKEDEKYYDASLLIDKSGNILGISKMVHIMQSQHFYEQDYYTPSNDGFKIYDTHLGKIGIVICFDRHLPESIRTCAVLGADLILIPTANIEGEPLEMFEWEIRIQAMQSSVFIAMCNRVGQEQNMNFIGQSIVVDPNGNIVAKADGKEEILFADIDLKQSKIIRNEKPFINLRRPELYL